MTRTRIAAFVLSLALATATLAASPKLGVSPLLPEALDRSLPFTLTIRYFNLGDTASSNATITTTLPAGVTVRTLPQNCTSDGSRVVCAVGAVEPVGDLTNPSFRELAIELVAPAESEAQVAGSVSIDADESDDTRAFTVRTFRTFDVTTENDTGSGSLREAIAASNAACTDRYPCKIAFRIPVPIPANGVRIEVRSPLPSVTASPIAIDGTTQTKYVGDWNPVGPDVQLIGDRIAPRSYLANGLDLNARCDVTVRGLVIRGFPSNGILLRGETCGEGSLRLIEENYIGTGPDGMGAAPNVRGIFFDRESGVSIVRNNLISGNTASGVYIGRGAGTLVEYNIIGLSRNLIAPVPNGASGVFIARGGARSDVNHNFIGFNKHHGVSMDRATTRIALAGNSFQANHGLAIDFGLDGVSLTVPHDVVTHPIDLRIPEITSARYDEATKTTIIEGHAELPRAPHVFGVSVYTNDAPDPSGFGEGQYYIGSAGVSSDGTWRLVVMGRLPGPWVTATTTATSFAGILGGAQPKGGASGQSTTTSEFSRVFRVTG